MQTKRNFLINIKYIERYQISIRILNAFIKT